MVYTEGRVREEAGGEGGEAGGEAGELVPPAHAGECVMRVGLGPPRRWEEGQLLVFDDSFEHEVWNRGEHPRAVLIVHLHHPQLVRGGTYAAKIASAGATVCDSRAEEARPGHPGGAGELLTMTTEASGRVRAST